MTPLDLFGVYAKHVVCLQQLVLDVVAIYTLQLAI